MTDATPEPDPKPKPKPKAAPKKTPPTSLAKTYAQLSGVDGTAVAALAAAQAAFANSESIQALNRAARLPPALEHAYAEILRANVPSNAVLDMVRTSLPSNAVLDNAREAMRYAFPVPSNYLSSVTDALPAMRAAREALAASAPAWTDILTEQARLIDATAKTQIDITPPTPTLIAARPDYTLGSVEEIEPPDTTVPDLLTDVSNHLANIVARTEADAKASEAAQARAHRATMTSNIVAFLSLVIGGAALAVAIAYH